VEKFFVIASRMKLARQSPFVYPRAMETPEVVCRDVLVKYKQEANGRLDYTGTGVSRRVCSK